MEILNIVRQETFKYVLIRRVSKIRSFRYSTEPSLIYICLGTHWKCIENTFASKMYLATIEIISKIHLFRYLLKAPQNKYVLSTVTTVKVSLFRTPGVTFFEGDITVMYVPKSQVKIRYLNSRQAGLYLVIQWQFWDTN